MEPALKQRLIGAAVLVAIAVIFLPMLIKGPAPESGVSDVSLDVPDAPAEGFETRELPLVTPPARQAGSVTGAGMERGDEAPEGALPTVDTRDGADAVEMTPPPVEGGDLAVSFGSYASADDARRVVDALRGSQLPGYQETTLVDGRTLYRVRIGPYDSRATAEAARLRAAHVRDDVGSRVVALDDELDTGRASAGAATPAAAEEETPSAPEPLPAEPAPRPAATTPATEPAKPVAKPAPSAPSSPPPAPPAAAGVGFAVQLGAFSSEADAARLRDRARAAGLSAFIERVEGQNGPLNRVQVGPVADRAEAERLKARIAAELGVNGFVHSHP